MSSISTSYLLNTYIHRSNVYQVSPHLKVKGTKAPLDTSINNNDVSVGDRLSSTVLKLGLI